MRSYREELWFETKTRRAYLNITPQVEAPSKRAAFRKGWCLVNAMHITASVYINDDEQGLLQDYDRFLERFAPHDGAYRHNETGEDNGDAHIKRQMMGVKSWWRSRTGGSISDRGSRSSTENSTAVASKRVLMKVVGE